MNGSIEIIAVPVIKKIFYSILGIIYPALQQKIFPLKFEHLELSVNNSMVQICPKENLCSIWLNVNIKNYTDYNLIFFSAEGNLSIAHTMQIVLTKNEIISLKPKESKNYYFRHSLTYYEANNLIKLYNNKEIKNAKMYLSFSVQTPYNYFLLQKEIEFKLEANISI
jgi:hypothetical protein